jgi:hypothetical protein
MGREGISWGWRVALMDSRLDGYEKSGTLNVVPSEVDSRSGYFHE